MHNLFGAEERTLEVFLSVLQRSGWKLVRVHHYAGSDRSDIVAEPI